MLFTENTSEMVVLTETNKNPFIGRRYGQERQAFFKSRFEGIPYFLSHLIDVHVDIKCIITSLGCCSKKSVWLAQRWCWGAGVAGMDGYLSSVHGGAQYLKAALKARLFNPQPRIKDPSRQLEGEACHLNVAMMGTGFFMPNPGLVTSLSCWVFFRQGALATLAFLQYGLCRANAATLSARHWNAINLVVSCLSPVCCSPPRKTAA